MRDTLIKSQEWEVCQEVEKSQEKMEKKKSQVQKIDLHLEALAQDLEGYMDLMDLEGPMDQNQGLEGSMDLMGLEVQDQDLMNIVAHLKDLNLKKEAIGLAQAKDLNLLIGQDHLLEKSQEKVQGQP